MITNYDDAVVAIKKNPHSITDVFSGVSSYDKLVLMAVSKNGEIIADVGEQYRANSAYMIAAITDCARAFMYAADELKNDKSFFNRAVIANGIVIRYMDELKGVTFSSDEKKDLMRKAIASRGCALQYVENDIKKDKECALLAIKEDITAIQFVAKEIRSDKEIVYSAVEIACPNLANMVSVEELKSAKEIFSYELNVYAYTRLYKYLNEDLRCDRDVAMSAAQYLDETLIYCGNELAEDYEFVSYAIRCRYGAFKYAPEMFKHDKNLVLSLIKRSHTTFNYVADELKQDESFAREAIEVSPKIFTYLDISLKNKAEFIKPLLVKGGVIDEYYWMYHVSDEVKDNPELLCMAVSLFYDYIEIRSVEKIDDTKELMKKYVAKRGTIIKLGSSRVKDDREIALIAVKCDGNAIRYINERFRDDEEIVMAAMKGRSANLVSVSSRLKHNEEVVYTAVRNNASNINAVPEEFFSDDDFVAEFKDNIVTEVTKNNSYTLKEMNIVRRFLTTSSGSEIADKIVDYACIGYMNRLFDDFEGMYILKGKYGWENCMEGVLKYGTPSKKSLTRIVEVFFDAEEEAYSKYALTALDKINQMGADNDENDDFDDI